MKILFIITRADTVGGAQVHVRDLARKLLKSGHEILVVTGKQGIYNQDLKQHRINSLSCELLDNKIAPLQDSHSVAFIRKVIHEFAPDLVSSHSSKAGVLGRLACKMTKTPCIFTAHGWAFTGGITEPRRTAYQLMEKLVEPLANKIICVSDYDISIAIKAGMSRSRLVKIHNGMPDASPQLRADPTKSNPVRIVMIARFDKQKDHLTLIKAIQEISGIELNLVGDGPKLSEIENIVKDREIENKVKFWGYCNNIAEILAKSQIFALISNWEGFPRTTIEAMRAGLPVVVSDVGGAAEAVLEGVTGYCVSRGNAESLQKHLIELVSNTELRAKMGQLGRKQYEEQFTFEKMFEQTFAVYETVVADKSY